MRLLWILVGLATLAPATAAAAGARRLVVIDPGHGGPDHGARGADGTLEKDVVLGVARRIGAALDAAGVAVVYTRSDDRFVSLPERTRIANESQAALYLSIHANSSSDPEVRGPETYFLSVDASDEEARKVAVAENRVFDRPGAAPDSGDLVGAILGDLIRTEHLRASSQAAIAIQSELARLPGPDRGVKQAPFVVLMGVNMPAALIEIGFLTHAGEARRLGRPSHQRALALGVARAVARHVAGPEPAAEAAP